MAVKTECVCLLYLDCFDSVTWNEEEYPACQISCCRNPKGFSRDETGLIGPVLPILALWPVKKPSVCVYVYVYVFLLSVEFMHS